MNVSVDPEHSNMLRLLTQEMANFGSEFAGTFANHAPMVIIALARLGGGDEQMQRFVKHYSTYKSLQPFHDDQGEIKEENWREFLGARGREGSYRRFFQAQLQVHGRDKLLDHWLPLLSRGVGASAFHALMRVAYAILNNDDYEIVNGLAYWCACWLEMPSFTGTVSISSDPVEVLKHAGAIPAMRGQYVHDLIWKNMRQSFRLPGFETAADWLLLDDSILERCASAAIALFAATQDFCALHAVTGLHWIRILKPWNSATNEMVGYFWAGVCGLMNEMDYPTFPSAKTLDRWRSLPCPEWSEIFAAARQSFDEHDLSLVFTCSQEAEIYQDPLYRLAAARRVGMIAEMK